MTAGAALLNDVATVKQQVVGLVKDVDHLFKIHDRDVAPTIEHVKETAKIVEKLTQKVETITNTQVRCVERRKERKQVKNERRKNAGVIAAGAGAVIAVCTFLYKGYTFFSSLWVKQ